MTTQGHFNNMITFNMSKFEISFLKNENNQECVERFTPGNSCQFFAKDGSKLNVLKQESS